MGFSVGFRVGSGVGSAVGDGEGFRVSSGVGAKEGVSACPGASVPGITGPEEGVNSAAGSSAVFGAVICVVPVSVSTAGGSVSMTPAGLM